MKNIKLGKNAFKSKKRELDEEKKELERLRDETDFEKSDIIALTIAAMITIVPVVLVFFICLYFILISIFS